MLDRLLIHRVRPDAQLPMRAHPGDAGMDLVASEDVQIMPGKRAKLGTGIAVAIPAGYVGYVHSRSGLAAKHGISVLNDPGVVDSGYRGELFVLLHNASSHPYWIERGMRIAQLVIQKVQSPILVEDDAAWKASLNTSRGDKGSGSTGMAGFGD